MAMIHALPLALKNVAPSSL